MVVQAPGLKADGFVLAGGHSRRMGQDKALLRWGSGTLIEHAVGRLQAVCEHVSVLCGNQPRYTDSGLAFHLDAWPEAGPLGGLLAGLRLLAPDAPGLFLAVDVPNVPVGLLRLLLEAGDGYDAVVPVSERGPEPLCALYRGRCAQAVEGRLAQGARRTTCFFPDVNLRELAAEELRAFGNPAELFANVNTEHEYRRWHRPNSQA